MADPAPRSALAPPLVADTPGTLEVVVVGAGRMGAEHAAAIASAGDRVAAFLDSDLARAESAAGRFGGQAAVAGLDLATGLEQFARAGATAVLIASPSSLHLAHATAAAALGLPVLLEKPPWVPGQDPGRLIEASRGGAVIAVGMTTRFNPGIRALRDAVRSGALGRVLAAHDRVAFTLSPGDLANWYFDPGRSGGGVLVTNGVHSLDRLAWILGENLVIERVTRSAEMLKTCEDVAILDARAGTAAVRLMEVWGPGPVPPSELMLLGTRGSAWTDAAGNWQVSGLDGHSSGTRPPGYSELAAQWHSFRGWVLTGRRDGVLPDLAGLGPAMALLAEAGRS
jgi:predicted dehydrogenase